jgi:hypothetical protein
MILQYLPNWPSIPRDLYTEVSRIVQTTNDELEKFVGESYDPYKLHPLNGELANWIKLNIPIEFGSCFHLHVISNDLVIHQDFMSERFKVNYIFQTGGDNVYTNFYNNDHSLIERHCVAPEKWHYFDGSVPHNASNITPGLTRIAITLGTNYVNTSY